MIPFDHDNTDPTLEERQAYDVAIERVILGTEDFDDNGDYIGPHMQPPWAWTDQQLVAYIRSRFADYTRTLLSHLSNFRDLAGNTEDVEVNALASPISGLIKRVEFRASGKYELFGHGISGGRLLSTYHLFDYKRHESDLLAWIRDEVKASVLTYCLFLRDLSYATQRTVEGQLKRLGTNLKLMIACVRETYQVLFGIEPEEWDCQFFDIA
jgi:hypothetical protein